MATRKKCLWCGRGIDSDDVKCSICAVIEDHLDGALNSEAGRAFVFDRLEAATACRGKTELGKKYWVRQGKTWLCWSSQNQQGFFPADHARRVIMTGGRQLDRFLEEETYRAVEVVWDGSDWREVCAR